MRRFLTMKVCVFTLLFAGMLAAADEQQLALALKAQSDFERVSLAVAPTLRDTTACVQSQAALLPVTAPAELSLIHFRKGFCALAGAVASKEEAQYRGAAAEFQKAIETWPVAVKNKPAVPMSSGLQVIIWVARLKAGAPDASTMARAQAELAAALQARACPTNVMPVGQCESILAMGKQWVGWIALRQNDLSAAEHDFAGAPESGWAAWTAGRTAFRGGDYAQAAAHDRRAIDQWQLVNQDTASLMLRLNPSPDLSEAQTDLGGALLLAGSRAEAIASLTQAVKLNASNSRAYYLRARAKELSGQTDAAMADYNLASRTAFAGTEELASGEAHLYRGMMFYRRKNYTGAEDEFAAALNFEMPVAAKADAIVWRHLAAVASGACGTSRHLLESSLSTASPFFPKDEARTLITNCPSTAALRGDPEK